LFWYLTEFYRPPYIIENALSPSEIELIMSRSAGKFRESTTVGSKKIREDIRKSRHTFLEDDKDTLAIKTKIARMVGMDENKCEKIQVVMYREGDHYSIHQDTCCFEKCRGDNIDERKKTVIVYLNDNFIGGETCFPNIDRCFTPKKGNALVFDTYNMLHMCTRRASHKGNPVTQGTKYICTFWFR